MIDKIFNVTTDSIDRISNLLSCYGFTQNDGLELKTGVWLGREKSKQYTSFHQDLIKMLVWLDASGWNYNDFNKEVIPILKDKIGMSDFLDELVWCKENEVKGYQKLKLKSKLNPMNGIRYKNFNSAFDENLIKLEDKLIAYIFEHKLEIDKAL